jgi:hypothetical protein
LEPGKASEKTPRALIPPVSVKYRRTFRKKNVAGIQFISKINPTIYPATLSFGWMFFLSTDVQPD